MRKVAFFPTSLGENPEIVKLKHPQSGKDASFVVENGKIFDLLEVQRPHSSFFVANEVISNGTAFILSEIHPLFVVLPYVQSRGKEMFPLEEFFIGTPYETIASLVKPHLQHICTEFDMGDGVSLYYDEKEALNWMIAKA